MKLKWLNSDVIAGVLLILVSIFLIVESLEFPDAMGTEPGPAFFPIVLSIILIFLSILLIIKGVKTNVRHFEITKEIRDNIKTLGLTILATILFLFFWRYLPFYIIAFLYLFSLGIIFKIKITKALVFSIFTTGIIYYVFSEMFLINLNL